MEGNKTMIWVIIVVPIMMIGWVLVDFKSANAIKPTTLNEHICDEDSLKNVITELQIDLENKEDIWDKKSNQYEDIINEYEFGVGHLEKYHLNAYKDFHRIIGYKEKYSHEIERENNKRLKTTIINE